MALENAKVAKIGNVVFFKLKSAIIIIILLSSNCKQ